MLNNMFIDMTIDCIQCVVVYTVLTAVFKVLFL